DVTEVDGTRYATRLATPPEDLRPFTAAGAEVTVAPDGIAWGTVALYALPLVAMVAFVVFLLRGQRAAGGGDGGAGQFGKSRARMASEEDTGIGFADVAGVEEAKADLEEVVEFLRAPGRYHALGARIPHGVLMAGPPGSGKTHLARAVAGEAGVPFFSISGSDFVEMFVGVGAARVRDLFETAKKSAPCIVFIDEIDAVGRRRGMNVAGGNDEREQTLNALLVEMDGFESDHDVIIMAATNRPDVLDPALMRPGRFDRQVVVDAPDVRGREAILRIHARDKPLARTVDLQRVAQRTPGFVGADLENLLNEGALVAARQGRRDIRSEDLDEAADRVTMGPERRSRVISDRERRMTAYHEAGHALAAHLLPHADPVHKITIVPRGRAMGYVMQVPEEDRASASRDELLDRIAVALAGRVTEALVIGDVTTGAQNDFQQATDLARRMVTRWGMSDALGPIALSADEGTWAAASDAGRGYSDATAREVDAEVKRIVEAQYERIEALLAARRPDLDAVVAALTERETLHRDEFEAVLRGETLPEPPPVPDPPRSREEGRSDGRDETEDRASDERRDPPPGLHPEAG
ncbi:MAG: ATP-dependent zinc metalloprotease FtsH, partial [Trueperaceae bacterium]|nr:ATP-dependent zinc metalloprotease FtsH [Trueperaceae bacterium]